MNGYNTLFRLVYGLKMLTTTYFLIMSGYKLLSVTCRMTCRDMSPGHDIFLYILYLVGIYRVISPIFARGKVKSRLLGNLTRCSALYSLTRLR